MSKWEHSGTTCKHCNTGIFVFDKAPVLAYRDSEAPFEFGPDAGWATDHCGDAVEDFICPAREASSRFPNGKPHEPKPLKIGRFSMRPARRRLAIERYKTSKL